MAVRPSCARRNVRISMGRAEPGWCLAERFQLTVLMSDRRCPSSMLLRIWAISSSEAREKVVPVLRWRRLGVTSTGTRAGSMGSAACDSCSCSCERAAAMRACSSSRSRRSWKASSILAKPCWATRAERAERAIVCYRGQLESDRGLLVVLGHPSLLGSRRSIL